ncbi:SHOCT domain-containing protein [Gordonia sp. (in: high G+C Gram-positive bacteria)]|uniref:SHOCT domain-containing protein n=1 Tax=Gordonia sp. (in: high G+C Gram-positive bacteria) TaxID=84139 RepID=UPI0016B1BC6B|nr:SHOCT domain-containing protein [Gordonia sp. (in: high G+C Gram-positive bacteria)]NLG46784.1 SHOCT domain-containing protein [Gordonia sp. (in: high G+C Gram-positive bacteria)]
MFGRGGRPGLIGLAARTAVVTGTANAMQNRAINRREEQSQARAAEAMQYQQQYQEPPQQYAPPTQQAPPTRTTAPQSDLIAELSKLGDLRSQGLLTDEEFAAAKAKLLA